MNSNLSDIYASFAKLSKIDKKFQTKRVREAIVQFAEYVNSIIFTSRIHLIYAKGLSILYNDAEIIKLNIDDLCARSFEAFCCNSDIIIRRIIRSIVNSDIDGCEISGCELIDIHRDLSEIYDKETVKNTERVKLIRNAIFGGKNSLWSLGTVLLAKQFL